MPIEITPDHIDLIGTGARLLRFLDDNRTLQQQIYLKADGTLNIGGETSQAGGGSSVLQSHALSSGAHTGSLNSAQAPQFLLLSGSRQMQGDLDLGGYNLVDVALVDGVDVSGHSARHESGGADAVGHDNLTGFVADEHVAHSGVTITPGTGLTGGGTIAASRTLSHDAGAFGDLHTNYAELAENETVTGSWTFDDAIVLNDQIDSNVTITGDLTVLGTNFIANVETVEIEDNLAIVNSGETGVGITAGFAGWEADRGTLANYRWGFDETRDLWVIGEVGDTLQAVATREDSPTDEAIPFWNDAESRLDTSAELTWDGDLNVDANVKVTPEHDHRQNGYDADAPTSDAVATVSAGRCALLWGSAAEQLAEREDYTLEDVRGLAERALSRTDAHLANGELDVWRWSHSGGMTLSSWSPTGDSTITIENPADGYNANLAIDGTLDGVSLAEFNAMQFLVLEASGYTPNERVLSVQTDEGLALVDNGAGGTYELRTNVNAGLTFGDGGGIELDWSGTPVTITPGATASAGSSDYAAHTDHRHAIAAGTPGSIEPDDDADPGEATSFSRSDHTHGILTAAPAANSVSLAASGVGDAPTFARSDHTHSLSQAISPTWTGTHTWSGNTPIQLRDSALKVYSSTDGQLDIDADTELELTAPTIQLIASSRVLVSGALDVDGNLEFQGAQSITTTADGLTLSPASNLTLSPTDDVLTDSTIAADNWASQTTGWGVTYAGAADFRSIYADELHVQAFIADIYQALVGGIIVTKSRARLSRDFTIPADTATGTLYLEDLEGWEDTQAFAASDIVRLRFVDTSGGGLVVTDVWGVVSSYTNLSGGEQSWTFTTSDDGGVSGSTIYAGSIALDYGQSGTGSQGVWEATVLDSAGAPYSQVATWDTNPWTPGNWTARVRLGNLDGLSGVGLEYGLFAGDGITDSDSYMLITDAQASLHNLPLEIHDGTNTVFKVDPDTPSLALGASIPTAFGAGDGVWMGLDSGAYKWRVGDADGERAQWDGSAYRIYSNSNTYLTTNGALIDLYSGGVLRASYGTDMKLYDATVQRVHLDNTGSGWFIAADKFSWNTDGDVTLVGTVTIAAGSTGISNLSDAGALATADSYGDISGTPTALSDINPTEGAKLTGIESGATVGATWGTNLSSVPTRFSDTPSAAGLYLSATHMGYYDGAAWKTYMDNAANFYLGGSGGVFQFDASTSDLLLGDEDAAHMEWDESAATLSLKVGSVTHIEASASGVNIGNAGRPAYERTY